MKQKPNGAYPQIRALRHALPVIFSVISAAGVVATAVSAAKAAPKAERLLSEREKQSDEPITTSEKAKILLPVYAKPIIFGALTIACIASSTIMSHRVQQGYIGAYAMIDRAFREYKSEKEGSIEETSDKTVIINDGDSYGEKLIFFEPIRNEYFERTMTEVVRAAYHFNRNFTLRDYALQHSSEIRF